MVMRSAGTPRVLERVSNWHALRPRRNTRASPGVRKRRSRHWHILVGPHHQLKSSVPSTSDRPEEAVCRSRDHVNSKQHETLHTETVGRQGKDVRVSGPKPSHAPCRSAENPHRVNEKPVVEKWDSNGVKKCPAPCRQAGCIHRLNALDGVRVPNRFLKLDRLQSMSNSGFVPWQYRAAWGSRLPSHSYQKAATS